jgi:4-amino-4-deoxy-L-arabinose transferase-like glycosyltransferase
VVLALVLRVVVVLATPHFKPRTDAADYDRMAVSLVQHGRFPDSIEVPAGGPTAFRPPLFPLALAGVYEVVGTGSPGTRWEAGRLFEAALGAATVLLICLIAGRLWGRKSQLASGVIAASYPPLALVGSSLMSESLFIPLLLGAVLAGLVARDSARRWRWEVLAGLLLGLAALTRGNGIFLVVPLAFLVWTVRPRLSWRALRSPLIVIAAVLVTLVPWTIRNAESFHQLVPISTETGYLLAGTYNSYSNGDTEFPAVWIPPVPQGEQLLATHPRINEAQASDDLTTDALRYVRHHPGYVLKVAYWNSLRLLNLTGTKVELWQEGYVGFPSWLTSLSVYWFWGIGLLALLGAAAAPAARRVPWAFWAIPIVVFVSTMFISGSTRYRSPADPFVLMLATLGALAATGWLRARIPRRAAPTIQLRSPAG